MVRVSYLIVSNLQAVRSGRFKLSYPASQAGVLPLDEGRTALV